MESQPQFASTALGQQVELYIQCRKLKDLDIMSKSDPRVVLSIKEGNNGAFTKAGQQTEVLRDNLNPDFKTPLKVFYKFEVHQFLKFDVLDWDSDTQYEVIGHVEVPIGKIIGAKEMTIEEEIHIPGKKDIRGRMIVKAVPIISSNIDIILKIGARSLNAVSGCCGSTRAPCFEISKAIAAGNKNNYYRVHLSETINNTLLPSFKPVKISAQELCNSDLDNPVQFKFQNVVEGQNHMIGVLERPINLLKNEKELDIIHPQSGKRSGVMIIEQLKIVEKPSFIQFLQMGWQISMCVAIDFTASNGAPSRSDSIHFLGAVNQYEQAIGAVGSILEYYDTDKKFPVYGFGGIPRFMAWKDVNHCFPLNGNYENPEVFTTRGILEEYRKNLKNIELAGPTYFGPILKQMTSIVQSMSTQMTYNILLIITDGEIHDMNATKEIIVQASGLPLSIIIIGVGNEKFKMMKELDSDKQILRDNSGNTAARDIVQFVKFKKYAQSGIESLAAEVLKEIPDQLVNYMMLKGIQPPGFQQSA